MELQDIKIEKVEEEELNRVVYLTWSDLWVSVSTSKNSSKNILEGVTGYACPTYKIQAYVTQDETLIATLTVKEAVYYSAQLQLADSMTKSEKIQIAEQTIKDMGLQNAMNTRIGGFGNKGISGGEKRRLSVCMEILTRPKLLFLDEPTSGLDSAASYYVMSGQGRTIIASIHQPSADVFNLFHSLYILSSGRTVYFGPASAAIEFFGTNGFPCPLHQNPSDHFLKTINKDFDEDIEHGSPGRKSTEEVVDFLINSYKSSKEYHKVQNQVAEICQQERGLMVAFVVSFMTVGGFPSFVEDMKVFQRENMNGHYGCGAFVIANTLSSMPYLLLISLVPVSIAYFLTGFQSGFEHFVYFALVLFIGMMIVESLMTNVAAIVPNFLMGIVVGAGIQGLMILGGGFFQIPNELPNIIWKYPLYYVSFHRYAYQGMFKNEFEGLLFTDNVDGNTHTISGEDVLRERWQVEMAYSKWMDLTILSELERVVAAGKTTIGTAGCSPQWSSGRQLWCYCTDDNLADSLWFDRLFDYYWTDVCC
ncbi:putative 10-deacetylbaccatin III 10-O-acetyltransferase-like [Capsicum annuum]|nr:putative 10-deacetylbaccatin III 10-O-acetyltransferase-like [Capsicum annuum]KAF3660945.1 putative 10-deacetylbaccatin III 10-O-acetyltransferase-like [Capsicum annuum]